MHCTVIYSNRSIALVGFAKYFVSVPELNFEKNIRYSPAIQTLYHRSLSSEIIPNYLWVLQNLTFLFLLICRMCSNSKMAHEYVQAHVPKHRQEHYSLFLSAPMQALDFKNGNNLMSTHLSIMTHSHSTHLLPFFYLACCYILYT